jgi:hypothetical protein
MGKVTCAFDNFYAFNAVDPGAASEHFHFQWSLRPFRIDFGADAIIVFVIPVQAPFPDIPGGVV